MKIATFNVNGERIYTFWRLEATGVDHAHRGREKPSDHAPVWITLRD